jgi:L-alanine-DL-glutamate epimerase-like enolase superfamily enzyme
VSVRIDEIEVVSLRFTYPAGQGFRYAGGTATGRLTTLVRVHTGDGRTGTGSAYTQPELARVTIAEQLAPYLRGLKVTDASAVWRDMMRLTRWYGRAGSAVSALGAVDTALWDLLAQEAGQPLWRYLGGSTASVPAYASGLLWRDDLDLLRQETQRHLAAGFRRVKMRLGRCRDYDEAAFLAVLETAAAGHGEVIVDGSMRYTDDDAAWLGGLLGRHGAVWFEEPFEPDNLAAYARLRQRAAVPVAAGESETSSAGLATLLSQRAVDIVQPDASRAGGITAVLQVAGLAQQAGARVATHTWSDAVAVLANAHVVASSPAGMTVEIDRTGNPFIDELLHEPLRIADGRLQLPQEPGLGVRLDETIIARYRLAPGPVPDGNYSDMLFGGRPELPVPYTAPWPGPAPLAVAAG